MTLALPIHPQWPQPSLRRLLPLSWLQVNQVSSPSNLSQSQEQWTRPRQLQGLTHDYFQPLKSEKDFSFPAQWLPYTIVRSDQGICLPQNISCIYLWAFLPLLLTFKFDITSLGLLLLNTTEKQHVSLLGDMPN